LSIEEEVRAFAEKYIPNGADYLASTPVPAFDGFTWEDVFTGKAAVPPRTQRAVLKRLHDLFGQRGR
jgi:hypothetical protein